MEKLLAKAATKDSVSRTLKLTPLILSLINQSSLARLFTSLWNRVLTMEKLHPARIS
jgi:hypothetical protein